TSAKKLNATVDFYSASTYHPLGIDVDMFTPVFAVSPISGWTAHVIEQLDDNRLIRPRADFFFQAEDGIRVTLVTGVQTCALPIGPSEDPIARADLLLHQTDSDVGVLPRVTAFEVSGSLPPAQFAAAVQAWVTHVAAVIGRPP